MHIQYLHTFMGSHMTPIQKSVSSDCMEGMPDIDNTLPPYGISFSSCCVLNTRFSKSNTSKKTISIPVQTLTLLSSNSFNTECCQLFRNFMAQEIMSELCAAGILHPSHHTFGLIQLRCRLTHTKAIYTGKCDMTKKAKQSLFPYSTRQRHLISWQEI